MNGFDNATEFVRSFNKDAKILGEQYASAGAQMAKTLLTNKAHEALDKYYADYNPREYERTNNFRNNAAQEYYRERKSYIEGGVTVSSENMEDYSLFKYSEATLLKHTKTNSTTGKKYIDMKNSKDDIFEYAFSHGQHGYNLHTGEKIYGNTGFIPNDYMDDYFNNSTDLLNRCHRAGVTAMDNNLLHKYGFNKSDLSY